MVKKKQDNPLAGLTRFNVDPNPVTPATLRANITNIEDIAETEKNIKQYKKSLTAKDNPFAVSHAKERLPEEQELLEGLKDSQKKVMSGEAIPGDSPYLQPDGYRSRSSNFKALLGPHSDVAKNYPEEIRRNPQFHFDYGPQQYQEGAQKATKYQYADAKSSWNHGPYEKQNKMPKKVAELNAKEPWRNRNPEEYGSFDTTGEYKEWVKTQYDTAAHGAPEVSVAEIFTPGYKPTEGFKLSQKVEDMGSKDKPEPTWKPLLPPIDEEKTAKEALDYIKAISPDDTKGIAETEATLSRIKNQKTGKVEEPALPQASEKSVAKKKKSEPEYVPSKSEKDFAAGRMPGITGTEAEAAASLARERKSRTAKVTGKAKDKLQAEIAAHPDFRGTRQLTDEEVAANEGGAPAPTTSKGKGKKKPSAPAVGSREAVEAEQATGRSAQREKPRPPEEPKKTAVEQYMSEINDPEHAAKRQSVVDAAAEKEKPAGKKRNFPNVNNKPAATAAETAAPAESGPVSMKDKYKDLLGSLTPEQEAQAQADMNAAGDKWEADMNATAAETSAPKTSTVGGNKFILNTDKSGTSEPVYGTASEAKANAERIRQIRTAREGGTMRTSESAPRPADGNFYDWGSETEPSPTSGGSPSKPGLGSRMRTFFGGGKGGRTGGAPTPASNAPTTPPSVTSGGKPSSMPAPSASTPSAPAPSVPQGRSGSFYNISGPVTFGDQTNLGRGDFGTGGSGGGIGINNSANVVFAPQVIGESRFGNVTGGTINPSPTVASTGGRATSTNKNATVLSTGGPASSGQPTHPRAQNAQRGGRPTTNNAAQTPAAAPAAPSPSNPRRKKP